MHVLTSCLHSVPLRKWWLNYEPVLYICQYIFSLCLLWIMTELDKRDLSDCLTPTLLTLALKYGESLKAEYEPLKLLGEEQSWLDTPNSLS